VTIRIKICCISSVQEARLAIRYGASLLGLVSEMPSGPGVIDEAEIAHIAATLPPGVTATLLTSRTDAAGILDQQRRCGVGAIQLVAATTPAVRQAIQQGAPGVQILQVVHVTGPKSLDEVREAATHSHAILLDSGRPSQGILGGTGLTHDWTVSRQIVRAAGVPVFLAGGLSGDNVRAAIRAVRPYGVDVCSGLRTDGRLDPTKLATFASGVDYAARSGSACVAWPG
jgi:phosphoribosylanthranilate isomerase